MVYMQWNVTQPQNKTNKHKETETHMENKLVIPGVGVGAMDGQIGDRDHELQTCSYKITHGQGIESI